MEEYKAKTFTIPKVEGISEKTMEVHLGLYAGYVKNLNLHYEAIEILQEQESKNMYITPTIAALTRRISFELAGVVNHELFFGALEGGPAELPKGGDLYRVITKQYHSLDAFTDHILKMTKEIRGVGWVIVTYDKERDALHNLWVCDHELGNVNLPALLAIDMWEHAYLMDYLPAEKGKYAQMYLNAINWETVEKTFRKLQ